MDGKSEEKRTVSIVIHLFSGYVTWEKLCRTVESRINPMEQRLEKLL
jgi:hypothetical protein